ncbi:WhiB family transcriptional regulator [Arthrobacter cheniae]|uniref:WhiB family transcriptional regulator n=1 Tax=Arthrobacter cheniae TaxID=1258888 RepID=A0A3A5M7N8_9MICC|nr:WhiB family transcriptional regulator [Arthrobacter cheniae]RJT82207.1 WhiB family transcriptional regulator [Arthrobacter cheniae]
MSRQTTRDDTAALPEFRQLINARGTTTLPCTGGTEWTSDDSRLQRRAASLCMACGARAACLSYALAADERHGVWGGTTAAERKSRRRKTREPRTA